MSEPMVLHGKFIAYSGNLKGGKKMAKHTLRTMRRCGELRMQGKSYRAIQKDMGNIGHKTVQRYSKMYLSFMAAVTTHSLALIREAAIKAEQEQQLMPQILTVQ